MEKLKKNLIPVDIVLGVIIVAFIALTVLVGIKGKASPSVPTGYDVESTEGEGSSATNNSFDYTEIKLNDHKTTYDSANDNAPVEDAEGTTDDNATDDESDDAQ